MSSVTTYIFTLFVEWIEIRKKKTFVNLLIKKIIG